VTSGYRQPLPVGERLERTGGREASWVKAVATTLQRLAVTVKLTRHAPGGT
jgi:hypothetical protein